MAFRIKLWGVRGSLPTPHAPETIEKRISALINRALQSGCRTETDVTSFLSQLSPSELGGFGGSTACIEVTRDDQTVIIDAGSGIRRLGEKLMSTDLGKGKGEAHIVFTHFHWDHLVGLPFFIPIFIPGNKIHLYAVQPELPEIVKTLFKKPFFPVPFEHLGAEIVFHQLEPRQAREIAGTTFTPYKLDHPDPCWGFKISDGAKSVAYCVDTECTRMTRQALGDDLPLYQNVDAMIFDAQYTINETTEKVNWGHAAAVYGLDLAMREKIRKVYFVHHDPAASDERVGEAEQQARSYYENVMKQAKAAGRAFESVDWCFAQEGTEIIVGDS